LSIGDSIQPDIKAGSVLPLDLVATPAEAQPLVTRGDWPGPAGYQGQFRKLWKK
jgi:hypothetical protein